MEQLILFGHLNAKVEEALDDLSLTCDINEWWRTHLTCEGIGGTL